ncbi:hypothetical protein GCM10023339_22530 [Alloalcanivorax gelatiniphagus]
MLTLVLRRAWVQRRLLASVVVLVTTACVLVGVCTLVLTATADRAFRAEVDRTAADDVSVTAYLVDLQAGDVAAARREAAGVVEEVLAPLRPVLETTATSRLRLLGDGDQGYLMTTDDLGARADLTSGRWPDEAAPASPEAVVPAATARLLGLDLGDEVVLGREVGLGGSVDPVTLTVVGTFRPRADPEWERDPLGGSGFAAAYSDGQGEAPTYGPFVVPEASFAASGSSARGVRVTGHPTLALADDASLTAAAGSLDGASRLLASRVDDDARITRLASDLSVTLSRIHAQEASTRATVLVVLLLGSALAVAAALLAGWHVVSVRDDERGLLGAMGLSRRQHLAAAGTEALLLALVAVALAVPAAAVVHARLTHLDDLAAAGLAQGPSLSWALVLAVAAAAVALTATLVATTLGPRPGPDPAPRPGVAVRLGLGVPLVAGAVLAWWQLRARPGTAAQPDDLTLTMAPVLGIVAATLLGVRVVPVLLDRVARAGIRSRSFVAPLAAQQAARRPHTGTAMLLVAAACASAVFGLALRTTWDRSQHDQAALRVGTDLSLTLPAPAGLEEATAVDGVLSEEPVASAVIHRSLALGRYVGDDGARPVLVALDTRYAGALLRGRTTPGRAWADVAAGLAPQDAASGVALPEDAAGVRLRGRGPRGSALTVVPTAVVEDRAGNRGSVPADPLPLDGRSHPVRWVGSIGAGHRLVGLRLELDGSAGERPASAAPVRLDMTVPGAGDVRPGEPDWQLLTLQQDGPVAGATVSVRPDARATRLRVDLGLDVEFFSYTGADLLATAFPVAESIPVVVSEALVDAVGARVGDEVSAVVGDAALLLEVVGVVDTVPSAPGQVAVLADADALSRALIDTGRLDPVVDAWWVADPAPATAQALRGLELGEVTVRQDVARELGRGPLRVAVPTTLLVLVALAVALLLAAVGLVLASERQRRSVEVVRFRALGLSRRQARRLLVAEHLAFFVPVVLVGAVVGVAATLLLGPHLVRSDLGSAPVPPAVVAWPWTAELLLVGGLLAGVVVITVVLSALHVRRSDPAQLRAGDR